MNWAISASRNNTYRLYVGDEKSPTTKYTPDKLHYISIATKKTRQNFRGFLLYVNDAKNATVGEFVLPKDDSPLNTQHAVHCPRALTHANAEEKPLVMTFAWRAPPAGAGAVTIRALLKQGDANTGEFFWPNEEGDVVLSEAGAAPAAVEYRVAPPGTSCDTICAGKCLGVVVVTNCYQC
jgi:hypothetical protein